MLKVRNLMFDKSQSKLANKVAKLVKEEIEEINFAKEEDLYVKATFSTHVSQNGVYGMDKFIGIEVEEHKTTPLCNCMSYDDMKYSDWTGESIWGIRKSAPVEIEIFYKFSEFTKKKMNEDFKRSNMIIDKWIEECHKKKEMVVKYFKKEEHIGDEK